MFWNKKEAARVGRDDLPGCGTYKTGRYVGCHDIEWEHNDVMALALERSGKALRIFEEDRTPLLETNTPELIHYNLRCYEEWFIEDTRTKEVYVSLEAVSELVNYIKEGSYSKAREKAAFNNGLSRGRTDIQHYVFEASEARYAKESALAERDEAMDTIKIKNELIQALRDKVALLEGAA